MCTSRYLTSGELNTNPCTIIDMILAIVWAGESIINLYLDTCMHIENECSFNIDGIQTYASIGITLHYFGQV